MKLLSVFILLISSGLSFAQNPIKLNNVTLSDLPTCEAFDKALDNLNNGTLTKKGVVITSQCFPSHRDGSNVVVSSIKLPFRSNGTTLNNVPYGEGSLRKMCEDFARIINDTLTRGVPGVNLKASCTNMVPSKVRSLVVKID